jgi:hypothetical protein
MDHIDVTNRSEQRKFGLVMAAAIAVLGFVRVALHWYFWGGAFHWPVWFLAVAAVFLVLGLVLPRALQPVFRAWMGLALVLNVVMTHVLLTLAFYLLITPFRPVARIFGGGDPLKRDLDPEQASYWEEAEDQPTELERYRQQF